MALCISCKGCKRECPTGVDMARMKIEFLYHYKEKHGLTLRDRLVAYLPRYAPRVAPFAALLNLRNQFSVIGRLGEAVTGLSARRKLPEWHRQPYQDPKNPPLPARETDGVSGLPEDQVRCATPLTLPASRVPSLSRKGRGRGPGRAVVLLVDTFNRWFEPENARAAERVLCRAGYTVIAAPAPDDGRPLCCGRTFLAAGLVDEARAEARRTIAALKPFVEDGLPIVGLEPSCLLTLRDEFTVLLPGPASAALAKSAVLFEEFVAAESAAGRFALPVGALPERAALVHGHCHQKAFNTVGAVEAALRLIPGLDVKSFDATCCGMAGSFGYEAEHYEMSMKIGELAVLPTVRDAAADTLIVAGGTSCRHQIVDGAGREAQHLARVLDRASAAAT
jgi:Fe-S oxidoreductase